MLMWVLEMSLNKDAYFHDWCFHTEMLQKCLKFMIPTVVPWFPGSLVPCLQQVEVCSLQRRSNIATIIHFLAAALTEPSRFNTFE